MRVDLVVAEGLSYLPILDCFHLRGMIKLENTFEAGCGDIVLHSRREKVPQASVLVLTKLATFLI